MGSVRIFPFSTAFINRTTGGAVGFITVRPGYFTTSAPTDIAFNSWYPTFATVPLTTTGDKSHAVAEGYAYLPSVLVRVVMSFLRYSLILVL